MFCQALTFQSHTTASLSPKPIAAFQVLALCTTQSTAEFVHCTHTACSKACNLLVTCRFEKYAVSVDSFWELLRAQKDAASQHVLDEVLAKGQELITMLGPGTFYGAVPDSTVTTVLLSVLQNCLPDDNQLTATAAVDAQSLVRVLVRAVASHLLQIMKPHSFLQQAHTGVRLPAAYEHFFNNRQEHYNLKQLFCSILSTKPLPSLAFEGIDSADELTQAYAEAAADEPESSAAGEDRAAAAASPHLLQNSPQLLQSSPPESKWVIFTSTTPDLDMGYVLPAGNCSHAFAKPC